MSFFCSLLTAVFLKYFWSWLSISAYYLILTIYQPLASIAHWGTELYLDALQKAAHTKRMITLHNSWIYAELVPIFELFNNHRRYSIHLLGYHIPSAPSYIF